MPNTYLNVKSIMFVYHHERSSQTSRQYLLSYFKLFEQLLQPIPHSIAICENFTQLGPIFRFLRNFRMTMAHRGVIHVRVNTPLEDSRKAWWADRLFAKVRSEEEVEECGKVPDVEERDVTK